MKSKKRISLLAVLVCVFALVFSMGLMSACGNTDDKSASGNWFYGTEAPADGLGHEGDFYLNTETLTAYAKSEDGTWTQTTLYSGEGAPDNAAGEAGDLYLDIKGGVLFQKETNSLWKPVLTLQGEKGRDGILWFSGDKDPDDYTQNDPAVKGAMVGDFYLKKGEFTIWQLTAEGWVKLGTIKGDKGDNATQFYDGKGAPETNQALPEKFNDGDLYLGTFDGFDGNGAGYRLYRYHNKAWEILMDTVKTNEVNIYNLAELQNFATAVAESQDGYVGKTVHLKANIDFEESSGTSFRKNAPKAVAWTPIGTVTNPFRGTFDGEGHTISNFSITASEKAARVGFFGYVDGATIEHLHFENAKVTVSGENSFGAVVVGQAKNDITVRDVTVTGDSSIKADEGAKGGHLVGSADGKVTVEQVEVEVNSSGEHASGSEGTDLVGSGSGNVTFEGENEVSYPISEGFVETHHKSGSETTIIYEISNLDGLKYFRDSVNGTLEGIEANDYAGKTVVLTEDIDFSDEPEHPEDKWYSIRWTPIGKSEKIFSGTFDGQNHILKNLSKDYSNNKGGMVFSDFGLFGRTGDGAVFCNFTLENVTMLCRYDGSQRTQTVAAVVASPGTNNHFSNIHVVGNIAIKGSWYVGGIVGYGNTGMTIDGCEVNGNGEKGGTITLECQYAGGIVGYVQTGTRLTNNVVKNITFEMHENPNHPQKDTAVGAVGGISGIAHAGCVITGSTVENVVFNFRDGAELKDAGAVAGIYSYSASSSTTIKDNHGSVEMYDHTKEFPITKLYNYGLVGENRSYTSDKNFIMENNNFSIKFQGVPYNTTTNEWSISSEEELSSFRDLVNGGMTFEGETVKLTDDIDLNNEPWTPIGKDWTTQIWFCGTFNGNGHTIHNLYFGAENYGSVGSNGNESKYYGLFGCIGTDAVITNFTIENVKVDPYVSKVTEHTNDVYRFIDSNFVGAAIGYSQSASEISYITVTGTIDIIAGQCVGGVVGKVNENAAEANTQIKENVVNGVGTIHSAGYNLGGIAGWTLDADLKNNKVENITLKNDWYLVYDATSKYVDEYALQGRVGGIAGCTQDGTEFSVSDNIVKNVKIETKWLYTNAGDKHIGAIVGTVAGNASNATITGNTAENVVVDSTNAQLYNGGVVGDCYNSGDYSKVTNNTATLIWRGIGYKLTATGEGAWYISDAVQMSAFAVYVNGSTFELPVKNGTRVFAWDNNTGNDRTTQTIPAYDFAGQNVYLADDIDLSEIENWTPIGTSTNPFKGTFDGKNFTISDLTINTTTDYAGLFGNAENVVLKNVAIDGATVTVHNDTAVTYYIGIFIACCKNDNSSISNVKVYNAKVQGTSAQYVGAIAGWMAGPISDCYAELTVTASTNGSHGQVGGIVGQAYGDISRCYAIVDLSGSSIGGIVGYFHCKNKNAGALVITISNCYATGRINASKYSDTCPTYSGGIIACTFSKNIRIVNNFFDGTISEYANSFIGASSGDDGEELEELTTDVFEKNSWNESLGATQKVQGYQGKIQIESLARSNECSFTAGMSYEAFLEMLKTLNG